jgi:tRNA(Ile)-lysidine synthase
MAARHLRYSYFEQLSKDIGASGICVAHHRDDSVETVLINLIRGTGLHGLTGIHPKNGNILRPLLCVSRDEIETFLNSVNQLYVTDSTNLKDDFIRNKIRLNIIPALREINPSISESIQSTSERIYDAIGIFDKSLESAIKRVSVQNSDGIVINTHDLLKEPSSEYILFTILRNYNFSPAMVKQIYEVIHSDNKDKCGKYFESSTHLLVFDRKTIIVGCLNQPIKPIRIPECGNYNFDSFHLKLHVENIYDGFKPSKNSLIATLDAEKIKFPLTIRNIENGDKFVPFGMLGKKLVSDYLTDNKKNMLEKKRQLIISDADGNIIWLIGERTDNRYRVNENTSSVLYLSLI